MDKVSEGVMSVYQSMLPTNEEMDSRNDVPSPPSLRYTRPFLRHALPLPPFRQLTEALTLL